MSFLCFVISFIIVLLRDIHMRMFVDVHIRVCIYICIYFGLRDFAILTIVCAIVLALVLTMKAFCFFVLFVGTPPVVQGAYAFGHIIAATLPENVPWCPWRIPIAGTSMSHVGSISG